VPLKHLYNGCKFKGGKDDQDTFVVNRYLRYAEAVNRHKTTGTVLSNELIDTKQDGTFDVDDPLFHVILNGPSASAGNFFLTIETHVRRPPEQNMRTQEFVHKV